MQRKNPCRLVRYLDTEETLIDSIIVHCSNDKQFMYTVVVLTIVNSSIGMIYNYRKCRNVFGMSSTP